MKPATRRLLKYPYQWFRWLRRRYFKAVVLLTVGSYQEPLKVNGLTRLTKNTILGSNTNFNGLTIAGSGKVRIGSNFHSGPECLIISSFHDSDAGDGPMCTASSAIRTKGARASASE